MVAVINSLIELDETGVPWIVGANTKVVEGNAGQAGLWLESRGMHRQHPHLSMAQTHAALSYYYEHQDEVNADIERRERIVDELRAQQKESLYKSRTGSAAART